jgi:MFS family permease
MSAPTTDRVEQQGPMSHREIMEALSGLLLVLFVAMASSTIVSTALPRIIGDLDGTQTQYTWVVTATLLTATASTPIWGKLADLYSKKVLVQASIVIFILGSLIAGFTSSSSRPARSRASAWAACRRWCRSRSPR